MFIKCKITFLLDTVGYWLCYHMKTLEIITHLAWIIIQIVQKLNCPYWVKTVFSVISLYMLHWKFANYSEADIIDFKKKKKQNLPLFDESWPNKRLGYKYL